MDSVVPDSVMSLARVAFATDLPQPSSICSSIVSTPDRPGRTWHTWTVDECIKMRLQAPYKIPQHRVTVSNNHTTCKVSTAMDTFTGSANLNENRVDVLIIGAGPTGLMCAHALTRASVNVKIVDKRPTRVTTGRADGIHPRTIEVLQSYGLADRLFEEGNQLHMATFYHPNSKGEAQCIGRRPAVNAKGARYPFLITLHQGAIEASITDTIQASRFDIQRATVPLSIGLSEDDRELKDPSSYPVKVVLQHLDRPDATETVHAKFLIGADGAHSWVRKDLGIDMEGEQSDYIWGGLDMVPVTDFPDTRMRAVIRSDCGTCLLIPREGDKIRLYIQLPKDAVMDPTTGGVDKSRVGPKMLLDIANKIFYPYKMEVPAVYDWWTVYIVGQRVASKFSVNERIFIAGDACHTHSPKAGQGMNAGINDAHNLAWKITQVLRGGANMSLLKTYEFERRQFAQELINLDKDYATVFSSKSWQEQKQDGVENFSQTRGSFISGIGVQYHPSSIINPKHQSCATGLVIGRSVPPCVFIRASDGRPYELQDLLPADIRFKILIFVGNTSDPSKLEKIHSLANEMEKDGSFLRRYSINEGFSSTFDILTVTADKKETVNIGVLPRLFRLQRSQVFVDDLDMSGTKGGQGFNAFGIDSSRITVVVVRPDGFVGMAAPSESIQDINDYFATFMKVQLAHQYRARL